jgi:hypothetical protein
MGHSTFGTQDERVISVVAEYLAEFHETGIGLRRQRFHRLALGEEIET